jgi:hypothetical protein
VDWVNFHSEMAALAEQLMKENATERTAEYLQTYAGKFEYDWRTYKKIESQDEGAPIPTPRHKGLHPLGCKVSEAFVRFEFHWDEAEGELPPPTKAEYQVRVVGNLVLDHSIVELEDHWRFDTHAYLHGSPSHEPHPRYHFQRGGHAQDVFAGLDGFIPSQALAAQGSSPWRALLQSPGPRIPVLPMCPILALDFTIGQHDGIVWQRLRGNPEYLNLVRRAQERLWIPFFDSLSTYDGRRLWIGSVLV